MKKWVAFFTSLMMLFVLAAPVMAQASSPVVVTVVVAGGLGDRSFYDSANEGLQMLIKDYGVDGRVVECKEVGSEFTAQLVSAAEVSNYVVAVGWEFYDGLQEVAPAMPNVKFVYVDQDLTGIPNLVSIPYTSNEGSFLVGYVAGKLSATHKVGAVGGANDPVINDFLVGYRQGARYANSSTSVESIYSETYEDPAKGKECALALFDRGCDIVFAVAGKTGEGVIEAAAEKGHYAIGVDADQKYINPDVIICSMKKNVGLSVYDTIKKDMVDKVWNGGTAWLADMASGYVDIGYGTPEMTQQVSDELKAQVETIKQMIIDKKIVVDTTR